MYPLRCLLTGHQAQNIQLNHYFQLRIDKLSAKLTTHNCNVYSATSNFLGKPPAIRAHIILLLFRSPSDDITQDASHRPPLD